MEIEIRELERKYAGLRIADPARLGRLTASIQQYGQQTPVLVVAGAADGYVLIDGYARVRALESLGRDLVEALILPLTEAEALIQAMRFEATRRRCALEDGWLLRELVTSQGKPQAELAVALQRSVSWISRRLALVRVLPESVQAAVQRGQIPAQAAMRVLVPLARAKADHCERLVERLEGRKITVRQMEALYLGYREGEGVQRQRLVDHPWLYLRAEEEVQKAEIPQPIEPTGQAARLIRELETLTGFARRVRHQLRTAYTQCDEGQRQLVDGLLVELERVFASLLRRAEERETPNVGSRPARGDPAPARTGARGAGDRPRLAHLEELRQASPA